MTTERRPRSAPKAQRLPDGRYIRFSWRYNTWQVQGGPLREWRNIRPELARCYAAAGFPIGTHGGRNDSTLGE